MIIRTSKNSLGDTSKQRIIPDCCNNPLPHLEGVSEIFNITCLNCHAWIGSIITGLKPVDTNKKTE